MGHSSTKINGKQIKYRLQLQQQPMFRRLIPLCGIARAKLPFESEGLKNYSISGWNRVGILADVMKILNSNQVLLTYIESQLNNIDKEGRQRSDFNLSASNISPDLRANIQSQLAGIGCELYDAPLFQMAWYPRDIRDLNAIGRQLLAVNQQEGSNSQQFTDLEYRKRRDKLAQLSVKHNIGEVIPIAEYTKEEEETWRYVYNKLKLLHGRVMCNRYNQWLNTLEKKLDFSKKIPQLRDIDSFLQAETGFTVRPTMGILSQRQFLNSFAHRIFCSTQYIRHHSNPQYTPEPDIVHEIVGHIPMFCDPVVCDISQKIGLMSLGATDSQISQLGHLYWFTIEFGACKQDDGKTPKGYGAGIGSSFGQMEHFISGKPRFDDFSPMRDAYEPYSVQKYQEVYKVAKTFEDAMEQLIDYGKQMAKPANMYYDFKTKSIKSDRGMFAKAPLSQKETDKSGY